jgi:hypothetical protein
MTALVLLPWGHIERILPPYVGSYGVGAVAGYATSKIRISSLRIWSRRRLSVSRLACRTAATSGVVFRCASVCCWTLMSTISSNKPIKVLGCMAGIEQPPGHFGAVRGKKFGLGNWRQQRKRGTTNRGCLCIPGCRRSRFPAASFTDRRLGSRGNRHAGSVPLNCQGAMACHIVCQRHHPIFRQKTCLTLGSV